ncbi:MAG: DUF4129 domain-containing protein [Phycisphaerae bacterium]
MKRLMLIVMTILCLGAAPAPPNPATPLVSHQRLEKILGLPGYHRWQKPLRVRTNDQNFLSRFLRNVDHRIGSIISPLIKWLRAELHKLTLHKHKFHKTTVHSKSGRSDFAALTGAMGRVLLIFLAVIAAGLIAWIAWTLIQQKRGPKMATAPATPPINVKRAMDEGDALAQSSDEWMNLAAELGSAGDWRMAYRAMYLALLSSLHAAGRINFRKSLTNRAYVARYRGPAEERRTFSALTELFDRVWYGHKPVPAEVRADVDAQMKSLLRLQVLHA